MCTDDKGNIYITESKSKSIQKFNKKGSFIHFFGGYGSGPGEFNTILRICIFENDIYAIGSGRMCDTFEKGVYLNTVLFSHYSRKDFTNTNRNIFFADNQNILCGL